MPHPSPNSGKRVLFKPIEGAKEGGCHARFWEPAGPSPAALKVAIMIHGGAFTAGDDISVPITDVEYLTKQGFVVVSLEYRLAPHVRFEEIIEDLVDGYQWVHDHLKDHIQGAQSVSHVIIMGWSAGATSACLIAYHSRNRGLPRPSALMCSYGIFDIDKSHKASIEEVEATWTEEHRQLLAPLFEEPVACGVPHMGFDGDKKPPRLIWLIEMIQSGSLFSFLCKQPAPPFPKSMCPEAFVDEAFPPTFIMVAGGDHLVPTSQSFEFYDTLKSRGVESALAIAENMEHGKSEAWDETDTEYAKWWDQAIEPGLRWMVEKTAN